MPLLYFISSFDHIHLTKICKIEPPDLLFLAVIISFYISRYIIFHKFLDFCLKFSFLMVPSNYHAFRDCQQRHFATLNRFCLLSKTHHPLFLMDNIKMDRIPSKTKRKMQAVYTVFYVLEVLLIKICKIQALDLLFIIVFISFSISKYHFSQIFKTSFSII